MVKCTFSGEEIEPGTGMIFVTKEGKALYFKNKKCEKSYLKLKRKPITTRWSKRYIKRQ
ncbi:50S ribosomal protein L24e [Candidatus Woesearchaeota archaeon]|nr:50S ribosomal protein L24e [Candidatus Woesearchaeota archaeon]